MPNAPPHPHRTRHDDRLFVSGKGEVTATSTRMYSLINISLLSISFFSNLLGSAMSVGGQLMGVFRQLGIYEKYCEIAKPFTLNIAIKESGEQVLEMDYKPAEEL
jgi:hypothetical protein